MKNYNCDFFGTFSFPHSDFSAIDELQRVGFIGLGNMGSRMANNLIKAGYEVAVHDL